MSKMIKSIIMIQYKNTKEAELNGRYPIDSWYQIILLSSIMTGIDIPNKEYKIQLCHRYITSMTYNNKVDMKHYREEIDKELSTDLAILNKYLEENKQIDIEDNTHSDIFEIGLVGVLSYEEN